MDADILQAIRIIDDKIASLQEARDRLAIAFGIENHTRPLALPRVDRIERIPLNRAVETAHEAVMLDPERFGLPGLSGRKGELARFLLTNGPKLRTTIVEQSGIPEGTVSYCLSDKRFFEQKDNGEWDVTEPCRFSIETSPNGSE